MKIFKIIIINLLLLISLLITVELYYIYIWQGHYHDKVKDFINSVFIKRDFHFDFNAYQNNVFNTIEVDDYFNRLYNNEFIEGAFTEAFRPDENINSNQKPILFMGCSFTWGDGLDEKETVSAQLAKMIHRPIYNRAGKGWGLAHFLYQTRREDFYKQFKEEPEYLIYVYISDHKNRLDKFKCGPNCRDYQPKYINKNGHLVMQKHGLFDSVYMVQTYQYYYNYIHNKTDFQRVKLYFTEARDEIRKHWPNTKLVILLYPIYIPDDFEWSEMEKEGYTVINIKDITEENLVDRKYTCDGWHPSASAWEIILPELIKKIDFNNKI